MPIIQREDIFEGYGDYGYEGDVGFNGQDLLLLQSDPEYDWDPDWDRDDYDDEAPFRYEFRMSEFDWGDEQWRHWEKFQETQMQFQLEDEEAWLRIELAPLRHHSGKHC